MKAAKVVFHNIEDKLSRFIEVKKNNPLDRHNRYGKHDGPMSAALAGFHHCHLRDDAVLIYTMRKRNIILLEIVSHAEIAGKGAIKVAKRLRDLM
jgi:mRNA-degrading endonuclease YafQ of YafQ-DinJ toxin-antitoxin module